MDSFFTKAQIIEKMTAFPVIPVFYHPDVETARNVLSACYRGGVRCFEFTNRGPEAESVFSALYPFVRENFPDLALGIGTIYNVPQAEIFIRMGADFLVQPVTTEDVADYCKIHQRVWIPGAMTLNEIYQAYLLGADVVKVFPGNLLGPEYIKAIRGPLPHVKMMVTGGVEPTVESLKAWFDAGVVSVGMGSQLFSSTALASKSWNEIERNCHTLIQYASTRLT